MYPETRIERKELGERIISDPAIMAGKPVVRGTRIPVEGLLEQLAYNPDLQELFAAYPRLTVDDVNACLSYVRQAVARKAPPLPATNRGPHPVPSPLPAGNGEGDRWLPNASGQDGR